MPFSRYLFSGCFHCQIHVTHLPAGDEQQSVRFFRSELTELSAEVGLSGAALGLLWEARGRGEPWPAVATVGTWQPGPAWSVLGLRRPRGRALWMDIVTGATRVSRTVSTCGGGVALKCRALF